MRSLFLRMDAVHTKFLCELVSDDITVDISSSDGIELGVFSHKPLEELFFETDLSVWEVFELFDKDIWDNEALIVTRLDNVRCCFMLSQFPSLRQNQNR